MPNLEILSLFNMLVLRILRLFLPPFHPLKYKYINWYYGKQNGGYWNQETKFGCTLVETDQWKKEQENKQKHGNKNRKYSSNS